MFPKPDEDVKIERPDRDHLVKRDGWRRLCDPGRDLAVQVGFQRPAPKVCVFLMGSPKADQCCGTLPLNTTILAAPLATVGC